MLSNSSDFMKRNIVSVLSRMDRRYIEYAIFASVVLVKVRERRTGERNFRECVITSGGNSSPPLDFMTLSLVCVP